ncbi:hypothetical protein LEGA110927_09285 [Leuconostoc gasicomitatum]|jgi:hypothetical protein|uniref:hypothetical protein n=1 Tax=Leuconostoc gasicomitatum TaxID=115778 RepID=UPI000BC7BAF1|nr:hypothetical protein [Leuconostoc gasicomitatum]MBZ5970844.1 hypothetical protein [Leuconostoc gasicomitatum]QDJ30699.1 hypothetical protein BHS02_08715 [Leuconostoc gelidum subsp. gelidum]QFS15740.1 hypothetical protein BHS03_08970 [Leuconostoc gasicomitatum]SOC14615.1 hypothetical protein LGAA44_20017 [Leuconostoc gasicomitatum]
MKKIVIDRNFYKKHDIYFGIMAVILSVLILQRPISAPLFIVDVIFLVLSIIRIIFSVVSIKQIN